MTAVFFVSGHGFGHASRQVEIIRALKTLRPGLRIILRTAASPALLARTLTVDYELRPGACDTGIVQASSISHDDHSTVAEATSFYERFDASIEAETDRLRHDDVSLIVGDIAPMAFEVAARLERPGVAIGNFTWDWIYDTHPGLKDAAPWLVPRIARAYARASFALQLPFAGGFESVADVRPVPLVARHATRSREETRARFRIASGRPMALLSFGGYGLPALDLASIDATRDWTVVTTDLTAPRAGGLPDGVVFVPESQFIDSGYRYEDLVAAADAVITKPGYGIIADCISAGTALLYTSRGQFREYDLLVRQLPRFLRSAFIAQSDLLAGRWRLALNGLLRQPAPPETMEAHGDLVVARVLTHVLDASR